jgi:3-oxoadipate enol-lactonase
MPRLTLQNTDLYYEVHGQGPAIVFVHGSGGNHLSWWQQLPALSQRHQCIVWDQSGYGHSRTSAPGGDGQRMVEDLRNLLDGLGIARTHLVGQSIGGHLCLRFALQEPGRVRGLVLADTLAGIVDPRVAAIKAQAVPAPDDLLERALAPSFRRTNPNLVFLYQAVERLNHIDNSPRLPAYPNVEADDLAGLKASTLFLVGENDPVAPPAAVAAAAGLIAGARFEIIPDSGHSAYFERPQAFNQVVGKFFATLDGPA